MSCSLSTLFKPDCSQQLQSLLQFSRLYDRRPAPCLHARRRALLAIRMIVIRQSATARDKLYARQSLRAFKRADGNDTDFARRARVCAAAWRQVEAFNLDETQFAFARRIFAKRKTCGLFFRHLPDVNGMVFPHNLIGKLDCSLTLFIRWSA